MKNLPLIFAGVFATLAFSWTGLILTSQIQYGNLQPSVTADGALVPAPRPPGGPIAAGKDEYIKLGCLYCHSQQVRPASLFKFVEGVQRDEKTGEILKDDAGNPLPKVRGDIARGFGPRHTVARDYITQDRVLLGTMRTGPDLANIGARSSADWHMRHMYDPQLTSPGSTMPPFRFLYKKVTADVAPKRAVELSPEYRLAHGIAPNEHIVPTERVDNLIAYLMSLKIEGEHPESKIAQ